ncbi:MAG: hypothetical protein PHF46_02130 [Candidatus Gracilibacteria bacterium]|nr:hypothetical protein [Candidatus Gracilibacteria bacterium]MDD4531010.1 hypothetical protein [Candidatus Gracilibacteria bacterium]
MTLEEKIQTVGLTDVQKEIVEQLFYENLEKKMSSYLNRFDGEDQEGKIWLTVEKNKKSLFNAKMQINLDGKEYRYEREDYVNINDLINHLFDHFKEALSKK